MNLSRRALAGLTLGLPTVAVAGCSTRVAPGPAGAARAAAVRTSLPPPTRDGDTSLEAVLTRRRSVRTFRPDPLTPEQLGQLMWAAQGETSSAGFRTAPSAGALYPLELYAATRTAVLHYLPTGHRVEQWEPTDDWQALVDSTPSKDPVAQAGAVFMVAAAVRRTAVKYGGRSREYVDLEAGHCAQNLLLQAVSLGLGAVTIGAYNADRLARYYALSTGQSVHYLIPVGRPA
jgi:SagB-type dehydrogenase family enzyme